MGKNGKFGKDYGKVVGKDSKSRPGWKGPGYVKKQEPKPKAVEEKKDDSAAKRVIPTDLQQLLLNIFKDAFPGLLTSDTLQLVLQEVKAALYDRDFQRAFGKEEYLEAYSIRWSPSRAICYLSILVDLRKHLAEIAPLCRNPDHFNLQGRRTDSAQLAATADNLESTLHVACFGGGAAEVIAFGGLLRYQTDSLAPPVDGDDPIVAKALTDLSISEKPEINLRLIDTAQWGDVVKALDNGLTTPPPLSKYASSLAKATNSSLIAAGRLATTFLAEDVLSLSQSLLRDLVGQRPMLLTLLFTLNELYTSSIGKTTGFLLNLTSVVKPGSLLLVVDSPGSYSETAVGAEAKKYPMKWLLDHTLLETQKSGGEESAPEWAKVVSDESSWFRLPEILHYPILLENMRSQIHLYRRL
jgi:25S rRNA (uracil2843-N3)-methyltransferase